jgi:mannosyltransferase OCH1-like enzyme
MPISKIVFQTSKKQKQDQYIIDKILSKCPDWKYIYFNDDDIIQYFNDNYIEEFKNVVSKFNDMPSGPHKSDLFRYYYLYLNGGVFIDDDAMIEQNIDDIANEYDFFSVYSGIPNTIFQGFIGSSSKNNIIYKALLDAYNINVKELSSYYHLLCKNLYDIIKKNESNDKIYLYKERGIDGKSAATINDKGEVVLIHYYLHKIVPK